MIALAKPKSRPRKLRPLDIGDRVRLDWPGSTYHGARGVVHTLNGSRAGVALSLHGDSFYTTQPLRRLKKIGGRS